MNTKVIQIHEKVLHDNALTGLQDTITRADMKPEFAELRTIEEMVNYGKTVVLPRLRINAIESIRRRAIETAHTMNADNTSDSPTNVMYNYFLKGTYVMPHVHDTKNEYFFCLKGEIAIILFDDNFQKTKIVTLKEGDVFHVPIRTRHTVVTLSDVAAVLETKDGAYDPTTDKMFTANFPPEFAEDAHGNKVINPAAKSLMDEWSHRNKPEDIP